MPGTAGGIRTDTSSRLAGLKESRPEWRDWVALLNVIQRALRDAGRHPLATLVKVPRPESQDPSSVPLLHSRALELDRRHTEWVVHRLLDIAARAETFGAGSLRGYRPSQDEVVRLLQASLRQDGSEFTAMAARAGVDPGSLATVASIALIPLLHPCHPLLQPDIPKSWTQGYCPICGAWPSLAERRGLDRSRWLRCGRCAAAWEIEPLWCSFCGEREHRKLGSLVPEDSGDTWKVETCDTCRSYLKSIATLQAIPAFDLLLQDLETVELDLVAREREYGRPEGNGFPVDLRLI